MNYLSRLLHIARGGSKKATKSSARRVVKSRGLSLERLEERWTPAIGINVVDDSTVEIVDDASGPISNKVEIIDNFDDGNTYIRINNGAMFLLNSDPGASGFQNIDVDLGAGNDTLIFSSIGAGLAPNDVERNVILGTGNDAFTMFGNADADFDGTVAVYTVTDEGGSDKYSVSGYFYNLTLTVAISDDLGNDVYRTSIDADFIDLSLEVADFDGNDSYTLATLGIDSTVAYLIDDDGAGNNKVSASIGELDNVALGLTINFADTVGSNSIGVAGNALAFSSSIALDVTGGEGRDKFAFDDGAYLSSTLDLTGDLGGDNDTATFKFDGIPRGYTDPSIFSGSEVIVSNFSLGDGNDAFTATLYAKTFSIDSDDSGDTGLAITVLGDDGNDKITFARKGGALGVFNDDAYLAYEIQGGLGDDTISVNFGAFSIAAAASASGLLIIDAGEGADKVKLAGTLGDSPGGALDLEITVGDDVDRDSFTSTLRSAKKATEAPTFGTVFVEVGQGDKVKISRSVFGVSLRNFVTIV